MSAFAADEVALIVGMVAEAFGEDLMVEEAPGAGGAEGGVFFTSSARTPAGVKGREVIGFREGQRLFLFEGA